MRNIKFLIWSIVALFLLPNAFAFDSSSAYNVVAMSFPANQTIFNRVVLNDAQKAQTSVTFTADVQNGGGRPTHNLDGTPRAFPTQTDSAFIRMRLHDAAGTLINTVTSPTYTLRNLGSDPGNGFSTKPGDNLHPWTLASVTYTGDLSNVRFIQLEMVGTDGSFWAGNYGPMWRVPTVTFGSNTTNTVYNPEFGIAPNSVRAQGWFNSSNSWAVCGVTSGNVPCVTAVSGVNANMWAGGYDINGGSLAGAVGGYNGTLSSSTADNAADTGNPSSPPPPPPSPVPTAIYNQGVSNNIWITNHYPTSNNSPAGEGAANAFDNNPNTKYLNFDKKNAGVTVKLNAGRIVTGFTLTTANDFPGRDPTSYKLYGSNNGTNWTLLGEGPVSLSDNRLWTSSMVSVTNSTAYVYYYVFFPSTKSGDGCGLNCDSMQIAEITFYYDSNNTTTSTDTGSGSVANPSDLCCGGVATAFNANLQFANRVAAFNSRPLQDAKVSITQIGNSNSAIVQQSGTRNNYSEIYVQGNNNITNTTQTSTNAVATNYIELDVLGSNNTINLTQSSTGGQKGILATVNNASNSVTVNQNNNGNHYAEITLSNSNKSVNLTQSGSAAHMAKIELSGGATSITATQSGSTQLYYSITHNCAQSSCAAISVTQGN